MFRDETQTQQILLLEGERVTVGREPGSDLALTWDPESSRLHAVLEYLGGSWTVVDDRLSRNGTFVNGTRVQGRRRLNDHDTVRFGVTQVRFRDPGSSSDETAPASSIVAVAQISTAQHRVLVELCRPLLEPGPSAPTAPSNREIAIELTLSVEAVRSHMKALFRLFEVPDLPQNRKRAELARRALAAGIVGPRDLPS